MGQPGGDDAHFPVALRWKLIERGADGLQQRGGTGYLRVCRQAIDLQGSLPFRLKQAPGLDSTQFLAGGGMANAHSPTQGGDPFAGMGR